MPYIRFIVCAMLLLGAMALNSQSGEWQHFSYGGEIRSLANFGNTVWIGSTSGLVRHDLQNHSSQFINKTNSPLGDNWISALDVSPSGILLIGSPCGLYRVQGDDWQHYDTQNSGLVTNSIHEVFCISDEELWMLSNYNQDYDYVYHLEGNEWTAYSSASCPIGGRVIRDLALDAQGLPWITYFNTSSRTYGISHYDGSSWVSQSTAQLGIPQEDLYRIAHDGEKVWVGSTTGSLYSIDSQGAQSHGLNYPPYNLHYITELGIDASGRLLVAYTTWDSAPYLLRWLPGSWEMLDPNPEVSGLSSAYALIEDAQGTIWFGTNTGMAIFDGTTWSGFDCSNCPLPSNSVSSLAMGPQDNLWMTIQDMTQEYYALGKKAGEEWLFWDATEHPMAGSPGELVCGTDAKVWFLDQSSSSSCVVSFDGTIWQRFIHDESTLPEGMLVCLKLDAYNRPWVSMVHVDNQTRVYCLIEDDWFQQAIFPYHVRDMVFDGAGNPWMATDCGLVYVSGETTVYNTQNSGLPNNDVRSLAYDARRNLWIGTSTGLARYADGEWAAWDPAHGNHPLRSYGDIEIDQEGRVWGATNSGLVCFDGSQWTYFTPQNSPLPSEYLHSIEIDSQNNIWMTRSGYGITLFNPSTSAIAEQSQIPGQNNGRLGNFPNPFNPSTTISFSLPENGPANLSIYNLRGQIVKELCREENLHKGDHSFVWNGKDQNEVMVSSGVYFARLRTRAESLCLKLLLMK
jgi:ligand-binding sensor domain-containing protein